MSLKSIFTSYKRLTLLSAAVVCCAAVAVPVLATSDVAMELFRVHTLRLVGTDSKIKARGSNPVRVEDNLRVSGNIRMEEGKKVDGVDVSLLASRVLPEECDASQTPQFNGTNWVCIDAEEAASALIARTNTATLVDNDGVGQFITMVLGHDGYPVIAYYDYGQQNLVVTACGSIDCTTDNQTTTLDSEGDVGNFPSIAIGADGYPVISYYVDGVQNLKVAKCVDIRCVEPPTLTTLASEGDVGYVSSIALAADGNPMIAYTDSTNGYIQLITCSDAACSGDIVDTEVVTSGQAGYVVLGLGLGGDPILGYYDAGALKYTACGNATCSEDNTTTTLIGSGVGYTLAMTIGDDHFPVVAYDDSSGDLGVVKCGSVDCAGGGNVLNMIDTLSDEAGRKPDITIGSNGFPIITHMDSPNFDLRVTTCGDASCMLGEITSTLDAEGDVGDDPVILLGVDGLPLIASFDYSHGGVKVIHGANAFFLDHWMRR